MDAEAKRGVTGKTWNDTLKLLRATFRYLLPAGGINPFADTPTRETETVFREPFTPEELAQSMRRQRRMNSSGQSSSWEYARRCGAGIVVCWNGRTWIGRIDSSP